MVLVEVVAVVVLPEDDPQSHHLCHKPHLPDINPLLRPYQLLVSFLLFMGSGPEGDDVLKNIRPTIFLRCFGRH